MKVIQPDVQILDELDYKQILNKISMRGRVCYKSTHVDENAEKFVAGLIARGHESVLEHVSFSVLFVCDRGVSHEIVRHRIASYSQESTRYCNYSQDRFGNGITVVYPAFHSQERSSIVDSLWVAACVQAEDYYFKMLANGATAQEARSVLPNSLKTELVMTANIREWRHFLKLRTAPAAHPDMRKVAVMLLKKLQSQLPVLFADIKTDL